MKDVNRTKEQSTAQLKASAQEHKEICTQRGESEERYKAIFESTNDILLLLDRRGRILDVNRRIKDIGGYEKEEIVGRNISSLAKFMPKKSLAIILKNFAKRIAGINVAPYEIEMSTRNGESRIVEIRSVTVGNNVKGLGQLAILRDVTEQRRKEEELKQSEESLRAYLESAPDAVYINDLKGTFLYGNRNTKENH